MNEKEYIDNLFHRLAKKKINLIIEYITQILSDKEIVNGHIILDTLTNYITITISVPERNYIKYFNLISIDHANLLYTYLFAIIFDTFKDNETIGISPVLSIRGIVGGSYCGMRFTNIQGSSIILEIKTLGKGQDIFTQKKMNIITKLKI